MTVGRILLGSFVALVVLLVLWSWQLMRPGPPIRLSKQTTYITEPLGDDGLPDYVAYLNAKYSEGVTAENNAAVLLLQAMGPSELPQEGRDVFFDRLGMAPLADDGNYLLTIYDEPTWNALGPWLRESWQPQSQPGSRARAPTKDELRDAVNALYTAAQSRPWTSQQIRPLAKWAEDNAAQLDLAVQGLDLPHYYVPMIVIGSEDNPRQALLYGGYFSMQLCSDARQLMRNLLTRAMWHLGEGRHEESLRDLIAVHRLGLFLGNGLFIDTLTGLPIAAISLGAMVTLVADEDVPEAVLRSLLVELTNNSSRFDLAASLDSGQRVEQLNMALYLRTDPGSIESFVTDDPELLHELVRTNVDWNVVLGRINGYDDQLVAALRLPDRAARLAAEEDIHQALTSRSQGTARRLASSALNRTDRSELVADIVAELFITRMTWTNSQDRADVQRNMTITAVALALYRAQHGIYPEQLDALVPALLAEVPTDAFADAPLHYERRDEGYLLSSVGRDGIDGRGTGMGADIVKGEWVEPDWRIPWGSQNTISDDFVIRVPVPAFKIPQPPLP
jgi:hypothetical protein